MLIDAGPLIAIIDRGEDRHEDCVAVLPELRGPLVTTWPAFTEAMYLLGAAGGWRAQSALWRMVVNGNLHIVAPEPGDLGRMIALMEKYADRPMDLADASLVVLAEKRGMRDIFTLDRADFSTYRIHGRNAFTIVPD